MNPQQIAGLDRYRSLIAACLVGGAIGDALGAPVEFDSLSAIRSRYGRDGIAGFPAPSAGMISTGLITDDTQMTLFSCEGLITAAIAADRAGGPGGPGSAGGGRMNVAPHVYRAYLRWLGTQMSPRPPVPPPTWLASLDWLYASRAPGNACLSGLASAGMGTRDAPKNPGSKGCGTVMRAAPFGLQIGKKPDQVLDEAIDASVLSHGHPTGYLAAGALAVIIRVLVDGAPLTAGIDTALYYLRSRPGHEETTAALTAARDAAAAGRRGPEVVESLGGGWVAEEALAIGVYAALTCPRPDPEGTRAALRLAVNHSGDSDSTGSVCGNLLGAWHGPAALPGDLAGAVEGRDTIEQVALDLSVVTWPEWSRHAAPSRVSSLVERYPVG